MQAAAHLFLKKALRLQKMHPGITERLYNVLLLIADGYCTSKHIYKATNDLNISGKGWNDIYEILDELEKAGLINYYRGVLKPWQGRTLGVLSCTAAGFAFVTMMQERSLKMSEQQLKQREIDAISKAA